jgi:WD40 repeat protein
VPYLCFCYVFEILCCIICCCRGEVFQVEWNPNLATVLATSAADKRVMIWDVNRYVESNQL